MLETTIVSFSNIVFSSNVSLWHSALTLRKREFVDKKHWTVPTDGDIEFDFYDNGFARYILTGKNGRCLSNIRITPTDQPYMIADHFAHLYDGIPPRDPKIWEATRWITDPEAGNLAALATVQNLHAMVGYGLENDIEQFMSLSPVPALARLKRLGCKVHHFPASEPHDGREQHVSFLDVDDETHARLADKVSALINQIRIPVIDPSYQPGESVTA